LLALTLNAENCIVCKSNTETERLRQTEGDRQIERGPERDRNTQIERQRQKGVDETKRGRAREGKIR